MPAACSLTPMTLADRALVDTFEVACGPCERKLLLIGCHRREFPDKLFGPHSFEDDLALALFPAPVDEQLPVPGDPVRELFLAHRSPEDGERLTTKAPARRAGLPWRRGDPSAP